MNAMALLCILGQMGWSTTKDDVLCDWTLIALYYLLCMEEYTKKASAMKLNKQWNSTWWPYFFLNLMRVNDCDCVKCPEMYSMNVSSRQWGATLCLSNQNYGWKNVCPFHFANRDDIMCPIWALGRQYIHIRTHITNPNCNVSTYLEYGCKFNLKYLDVRVGLIFADRGKNYPALVFILHVPALIPYALVVQTL